jgi:hypothetical protein
MLHKGLFVQRWNKTPDFVTPAFPSLSFEQFQRSGNQPGIGFCFRFAESDRVLIGRVVAISNGDIAACLDTIRKELRRSVAALRRVC